MNNKKLAISEILQSLPSCMKIVECFSSQLTIWILRDFISRRNKFSIQDTINKFNVNPAQVKSSIDSLLILGFLNFKGGYYYVSQEQLSGYSEALMILDDQVSNAMKSKIAEDRLIEELQEIQA